MLLHTSGFLFSSLALCWLGFACSAQESPPAGDGGEAVTLTSGTQDPAVESGQTGSIAPSQCREDVDCGAFIEQDLQLLAEPLPAPERFSSARCIELGTVGAGTVRSGTACDCQVAGQPGVSRQLGPAIDDGCSARGRLGECIAAHSEFPGCTPALDSAECVSACAALESALHADAERTFDAMVRLSRCALDSGRTQPAYTCEKILKLDGGCYTTTQPDRMQRQDCSLTDDEILAAAKASP